MSCLAVISQYHTPTTTTINNVSLDALLWPHCHIDNEQRVNLWNDLLLTGSEKIRKYWKHYYSGAEGVIFMVDGTSNVVQLETARAAMQEALSDPQLSGLPILLLVTHQDKENCRSFIEVWLQLCVIGLIIYMWKHLAVCGSSLFVAKPEQVYLLCCDGSMFYCTLSIYSTPANHILYSQLFLRRWVWWS